MDGMLQVSQSNFHAWRILDRLFLRRLIGSLNPCVQSHSSPLRIIILCVCLSLSWLHHLIIQLRKIPSGFLALSSMIFNGYACGRGGVRVSVLGVLANVWIPHLYIGIINDHIVLLTIVIERRSCTLRPNLILVADLVLAGLIVWTQLL